MIFFMEDPLALLLTIEESLAGGVLLEYTQQADISTVRPEAMLYSLAFYTAIETVLGLYEDRYNLFLS